MPPSSFGKAHPEEGSFMKKIFVISTLMVIAAELVGCSTAGPFVTNISSDGAGGLTVEKCLLHFNGWNGNMSNTDCTNVNLKLGNASSATK